MYTDCLRIQYILSNMGVDHPLIIPWSEAYAKHLDNYKINTKHRIASFFANVLFESSKLKHLEENLSYSAKRLAQVFPARYSIEGYNRKRVYTPNNLAYQVERNPKAFANKTYANRMGNGNEASGDGYRYRGRGPIQLTGKDNYRRLTHASGIDFLNHPDKLLTVEGGVISSCWYYNSANCYIYADRNDFDGVRDMVNKGRKTTKVGDTLDYSTALSYYKKILEICDYN